MNFDWIAIYHSLPSLAVGAQTTVWLTTISVAGGLAIGILFGVLRAYAPWYVSAVIRLYVGLIRGTPMVVQVMFIYFALPLFSGFKIPAIAAGIIALVINSSAYLTETVRGGLESVPKGMMEAGMAMGLSTPKTITNIIIPIAFRRMIPSLGNQLIITLKDTSILIIIGVAELTRTGQEIMTENYKAVEIWAAVALIYLLLVSILSFALQTIEKRLGTA